ncbi:NAD-dependent epimerase/dehydratase family protein [Myceligenerans xiligouense]|uniref:NAD-dependent epimerase/dehydratase family protein n=1 Tax=Myceligenerans xiligouense TaxID=253184 RepID=UPI001B866D1D|nr:NAD-dependent epimerase/dehydratase family protein [Myceligenerans xiligouense]
MELTGRHVVVTGSSGMLGSALVRRLAADGAEVTGVDRRPDPDAPDGVEQVVADVRDEESVLTHLHGADAVVHCVAALPSYPADEIRTITVGGTRAVLGAARRAGTPRFVHISSTAVYGLPLIVPTPVSHPREPVDTYSAAKAEAEVLCEEAREAGLRVTMLRPKTFVGPGRMGLFSMLFEWADEGRNFPVLGDGKVRTQMLGIDDLVEAIVLALRADDEVAMGTYNIGAAEFGTLRDDFQAVLDAAGHGGRVVGLPQQPTVAVLSALGKAGASPVYGRLIHKLRRDSYVDISESVTRLGFRPRQSNRDAILATFDWWREQRAGQEPGSTAGGGVTSRDAWRQGALALAKFLF